MTKSELKSVDWSAKGIELESKSAEIQFSAALEFIQFIDVKKCRRIADVGSGPGHQSKVLSAIGADVTCVDPTAPHYPELRWIPPERLEELRGKIDGIWSHHCLEHIRDPIGALIQWHETLPPGGTLFLTVPQIEMTMSSGHINSYTLPLLVYQLAIAGFDTSEGRFMKRDSHLRVVAVRSAKYSPGTNPVHSLSKLAELGLFPESVRKMVEKTGRFNSEALTLRWFDRTLKPARGAADAITYTNNSLWR